jgi:tryptophanyl-tRNA synthetase
MRPTGPMHLGHLVGVLNNWKALQERYDSYYMVADWHALMSEYESPAGIKSCITEMVADWLCAGIDPEKSTIFIQSQVKEHLELFVIFSNIVSLAWLERCPTYKEQLRQAEGKDLTTYGFLGYPVLQAADILVYSASVVPIGMDQMPHLELTREIVRRFNNLYGEVFPEPEALFTQVPKLLGTDNRKMSKSYDNFISLGDSDEEIIKKTSRMITDPKRIRFADKGHPDKCNVCSYYKTFAPDMKEEVENWCKSARIGCTDCKKKLSEIIINNIGPHRKKREHILGDREYIENILEQGAVKARDTAYRTLLDVYKAMGLRPTPKCGI